MTPWAAGLRDAATDAAFGFGWSAIRRMPAPAAYALFEAAANRTWSRRGPGVRQLEANLARVLPAQRLADLPELSRQGVSSYFRYWCDAFRLPSWSVAYTDETFFPEEGLERLDAFMAAGRGVVAAIPHMGNWDHAGAWGTARYGSLTTVAERLKPEGLFDRFVEYRESLGMEVLALGEPQVVRTLARRLQAGGLVALLADRDLTAGGIPVSFFGQRASMPAGPAVLSIMTGAPLVPVTLWYSPAGTHASIGEPIPDPGTGSRAERAAAMTQALAHAFEPGIAAHPQDWHMMQRLWLADLDPRRSAGPAP